MSPAKSPEEELAETRAAGFERPAPPSAHPPLSKGTDTTFAVHIDSVFHARAGASSP